MKAKKHPISRALFKVAPWILLPAVAPEPTAAATGASWRLYEDPVTHQVYTEPGKNRIPLGRFEKVEESDGSEAEANPAPMTGKARLRRGARDEGLTREKKPLQEFQELVQDEQVAVEALEERLTPLEEEIKRMHELFKDATAPGLFDEVLKKKWYERLSFRGYTQFRYNEILSDNDKEFFVPTDRSIGGGQTFYIRRGRLILSGDVAEHLFLYIQPDLNATVAGDFALQLRDMYGDISIDKKKEFRFRLGQSKIPFGFVNMQSSQNRLPLERPDAINSAAETERDVGAFFYWAPYYVRERFKYLVKSGLKGSGDYGVLGFGVYSGQGPNRLDVNDDVHFIARATYPFQLPHDQIFEASIQAYTGTFRPRVSAIPAGPRGRMITPTFRNSEGLLDQRLGFTAVWYPQPIGFEAEWNFGRGPELSDDKRTIGVGSLQGGYILANVMIRSDWGLWYPFARWQYFDGARKFAVNAPQVKVNEWDIGLEWLPWPEVEVTMMYTHTIDRTDSSRFPYAQFEGDLVGMQVQWNY